MASSPDAMTTDQARHEHRHYWEQLIGIGADLAATFGGTFGYPASPS
jgi:hypothetical protein